MTTRLWHFTCRHAAAQIGPRGFLLPFPQPTLGGRQLVWLTDLRSADRDGLGLTSTYLACDRTEVRYMAIDPPGEPWAEWCAQNGVSPDVRAALEAGRTPSHWWVCDIPVKARRA